MGTIKNKDKDNSQSLNYVSNDNTSSVELRYKLPETYGKITL